MAEEANEKIDVAVNIFAKPFQTSLSLLSLLRQSGQHVGKIWLQYEPMGSIHDKLTPYCIYEYLKEAGTFPVAVYQPKEWLARGCVTANDLKNSETRASVRYQYAFENSHSRLLFLMHNDVFILKDILGAMASQIDDAFAIGQLGQCWNCPASNADLAQAVMKSAPCQPQSYKNFRPDYGQLCELYSEARKKDLFARPYDKHGFSDEFKNQPWPLPECRINEWACLINLEKVKPLCAPYGDACPPGAFRECSGHNLDIGVSWFRDMHAKGLYAKNFDIKPYLKHWVGTGNKTPIRYARNENNALQILKKHFGDYVEWLYKKYGQQIA